MNVPASTSGVPGGPVIATGFTWVFTKVVPGASSVLVDPRDYTVVGGSTSSRTVDIVVKKGVGDAKITAKVTVRLVGPSDAPSTVDLTSPDYAFAATGAEWPRLIDQTVFSSPPSTATIAVGDVVPFAIASPADAPAAGAPDLGTIGGFYPVTGRNVRWVVQRSPDGKDWDPAREGRDFLVVAGGLTQPLLSVIFMNPRDDEPRWMRATAELTLYSAIKDEPEVRTFASPGYVLRRSSGVLDRLIRQCVFVGPTLSLADGPAPPVDAPIPVPAGTELPFSVIVPPVGAVPPIPGGAAAALPPVGSSVSWSVQTSNAGEWEDMQSGSDYHLLGGSPTDPAIKLVFKPVPDRLVRVQVTIGLFSALDGTAANTTRTIASPTFKLQAITPEAMAAVRALVTDALTTVIDNPVLEPGQPLSVRIVQNGLSKVPQVVTSLLSDTPQLQVTGKISVDSVVNALLSSVTSTITRVIPGSRTSVDQAGSQVRNLLSSIFTIPVGIEMTGSRLVRTSVPVGAPAIPQIALSPDGRSLEGVVPVGAWPLAFTTASMAWFFSGTDVVPSDLSPSLSFMKSFLLKPAIRHMAAAGGGDLVMLTPIITLAEGELMPEELRIELPTVSFTRLPLAIPKLAAVFRHRIDWLMDPAEPQAIYLTSDNSTARFVTSLGDCIALVNTLNATLGRIMALAPSDAGWDDIKYLAQAASLLAEWIARTPDDRLFFQPCWTPNQRDAINLDGSGPWFNQVSAMIAIGMPASGMGGDLGVVLSNSNSWWVTTIGTTTYSCVIRWFGAGPFSNLLQIPPKSANASSVFGTYENNLNYIGYMSRAPS